MRIVALLACVAVSACANPERKAPYTTEPVPVDKAGGFACAAE